MVDSDLRIGIFDSGIGGKCVLHAIQSLLPDVATIYYADTANCPYGNKSYDFIITRAREITKTLIAKGAKIIVVACNTATAAAIDILRKEFSIPFVAMEPAIKPAAKVSKIIGVLATPATLRGRLYKETSAKLSGVRIIEHAVTGWVEAVEAGKTSPTPETIALVRRELSPLLKANVTSLVLGCTHFVFLKGIIELVTQNTIPIFDPSLAIAHRVEFILNGAKSSHITHEFISNSP